MEVVVIRVDSVVDELLRKRQCREYLGESPPLPQVPGRVRSGSFSWKVSSNSEKSTPPPVRAVFPNGLPDLTEASQAPGFGQGAIRKKQIRKFLCPYKARAHPAEIRVSVTNLDP